MTDMKPLAPLLVLVGGQSGVGKTTIINFLVEKYPGLISRPTSYTSRESRGVEDSKEYLFTTKEHLSELHAKGELINLDKVYGQYYGIAKASFYVENSTQRFLIKEAHPRNHFKIRSAVPNAVSVLYGFLGNSNCAKADRSSDDTAYFNNIDFDEFDIVIFREHFQSAEAAAEALWNALNALSRTIGNYPAAKEIDDTNREGYTKAAPEFVDNSRLTTRNFHDLTAPYFWGALEKIRRGGKGHTRCLEIGPGRGWFYRTFAPGWLSYIGVEISDSMLSYSTDGNQYICSTARRLPFVEKSFDLVVCSLCDPYFYPLALCEIRRVMSVGGTAIFTLPSRHWSRGLRAGHEQNKTRFRLSDGTNAEVYSFTYESDEIRELLQLCGYESIVCDEITGRELNHLAVSSAITDAASNLGTELGMLPIMMFAIAKRNV